MIQTLIRNWWLLVLCGVLEAVYAVMNLFMLDPEGSPTLRTFGLRMTVVFLGKFALAAGVCAVAAGVWRAGKGKSWLLALNGLALSAFGWISIFYSRGRLAFLPVALLFVVMALSLGVPALAAAPTLRRHAPDQRLLRLAGAGAAGFGLGFAALGFGWIELQQPGSYFLWTSCYFGFSAICMLGLGLRLNRLRAAIHRMAASALPAG